VKYVFLAVQDEKHLEAMSPAARLVFEEACRASEQELRRSGHLYAMEDLQKDSTAIAVQILDGRLSFTDSPFISTKGLSVRLFFIQARDLNAAIQIASKMPQAHQGFIEVRPILEFESGNTSLAEDL
jgi:hypothetical protein